MAVTAIDPQIAYMVRMAEWNRLLPNDGLHCFVGGPIQFGESPSEKTQDKYGSKNSKPGDGVCTWVKNLGHSWMPMPGPVLPR